MVTPTAAAVPDVVSLLEQMNSSRVPAMQLWIWQVPVSPLLPIRPAKRSGFQRARLAMYPHCLPRGISTLRPYVII